MEGDQLHELLQANFSLLDSPNGLGFSSFVASSNDFVNSLANWCGEGVEFLDSDQLLVYLDPTHCSSSSSHSSQVSMDDDWSPSCFLNHSMNLQESILLANSTRKLSEAHQEKLFHEANQSTESFYPYGHLEPASNLVSRSLNESLLPHFPRICHQNSMLQSEKDHQRHLRDPNTSHLDISERRATDHQSIKQQTILKSSKTTAAKRKNPATKKSENGKKKQPRNETNSSLLAPSNHNKGGKEKMGNRITTLQRLVSPFGKADTASVLSECIEYIRFLHEQVSVLSTSYAKGNRAEMQHFQDFDDCFYEGCASGTGSETGLRSRGLCIVPVSATFSLSPDTPSGLLDTDVGGI